MGRNGGIIGTDTTNGFYDAAGEVAVADRPGEGEELYTARTGAVPAAGRRSADADPGKGSAAAWEGLLQDLFRRGLQGRKLRLIVTDGCEGLAAIQTVYPHAQHQRCWVHKMRNILEKVRKRDYPGLKAAAQAHWKHT